MSCVGVYMPVSVAGWKSNSTTVSAKNSVSLQSQCTGGNSSDRRHLVHIRVAVSNGKGGPVGCVRIHQSGASVVHWWRGWGLNYK